MLTPEQVPQEKREVLAEWLLGQMLQREQLELATQTRSSAEAQTFLSPQFFKDGLARIGAIPDLFKIGKALHKLQNNPRDFEAQYLGEKEIEQGYVAFRLPHALTDRFERYYKERGAQAIQSGLNPELSLGPELRLVTDPKLANEIGKQGSSNKGLFHFVINLLRHTPFNSGGEAHRALHELFTNAASTPNTLEAMKAVGPTALSGLTSRLNESARTGEQIELVGGIHEVVAMLFAQEYFPELKLDHHQLEQVRTLPTKVFGMGAGSELLEHIPSLKRILEKKYRQGRQKLETLFFAALREFAETLKKQTVASDVKTREAHFMLNLCLDALEKNNFDEIIDNLLSAVAAGTDTTTQVVADVLEKLSGEDGRKLRKKIVAEITDSQPEHVITALESGDMQSLSATELRALLRAEKSSSTLAELIETQADESTPVRLTFAEVLDDTDPTKSIVYAIPISYLAGMRDEEGKKIFDAFGAHGDRRCTGPTQAKLTAAYMTIFYCFSPFTLSDFKKAGQPPVHIVGTDSTINAKVVKRAV